MLLLETLYIPLSGGEPPVCSNIKAAGPPSPKAEAHLPMVCGSRSSSSAVAPAVKPWAISRMAYHLSRSRGVGARIIRRRRSLTPICHCSRDRSISLTPIINPSRLPRPANTLPQQIYPMLLRVSPWLWFRSRSKAQQFRQLLVQLQNVSESEGYTLRMETVDEQS